MSGEKLGENSNEDAARASAWDMLTKLSQENPDEPSETLVRPSREFKKESQAYREIGEEFIPKMSGREK